MYHQLVLAFFVLAHVSFTRASYSIDDRDSRIQYFGPHWGQHDDPTAYMGTTTDNACVTADGCYFTVSFNGSGISLTRFIITSIPIPLQATVTVDSVRKPDISVPDDSPVATVYDLQSLTYGAHIMRVNLVSYSGGVQSHFRLDQAIINDTAPPPATTPSPSASTSAALVSHSPSALPATAQTQNKKTPVAAIAGGTVAGVVVIILVCLLLLHKRPNRNRPKPILEIDRVNTAELTPTPFVLSTPFVPSTLRHPPLQPAAPTNAYQPFTIELQADPEATISPETIVPTSPSVESRYPSTIQSPAGTKQPAYLSPQPSTMMHAETLSTGHTDTDRMSIPGSTAPSIATSEPLMSRFGMFKPEDVTVMAQLMRQGVSVPDALRILEAKQNIEEAGSADGVRRAESSVASTSGGAEGVRRAVSSVASTSVTATSVAATGDIKGERAEPESSGDQGEPSGAPPAYSP